MNNENLENLKKFKRDRRNKELKKKLTKIVVEGEKYLYKGKKLMIVVIIPALEILANLLTIMDNNDDDYMY